MGLQHLLGPEATHGRPMHVNLLIGEAALPVLEGVLPEHTPNPLSEMIASMSREQFEHMMRNTWPAMMETSFFHMTVGQRTDMLDHCRGILDDMEERFAIEPRLIAGPS